MSFVVSSSFFAFCTVRELSSTGTGRDLRGSMIMRSSSSAAFDDLPPASTEKAVAATVSLDAEASAGMCLKESRGALSDASSFETLSLLSLRSVPKCTVRDLKPR